MKDKESAEVQVFGEEDFDWVKARGKCKLEVQWIALRWKICDDTQKRNQACIEFRNKNGIDLFEVKKVSETEFCVDRNDAVNGISRFFLHGDHIALRLKTNGPFLCLTLTLNNSGNCRFKIDGQGEHKLWQVSRIALENLFFNK